MSASAFDQAVKEFSIRPSEVKSDDAKKVAKKMIMALSETGRKEDIGFILNQFENAITSKAVTMRKSGLIKDDAGVLEYISNVKSKTGIEEFKKNPAAAAKQIEAIIEELSHAQHDIFVFLDYQKIIDKLKVVDSVPSEQKEKD
jgi:hypothetical protein